MTPTMPWRLNGGNLVAPLRRQSGGALTPTTKWLLNAENSHLPPMRSVEAVLRRLNLLESDNRRSPCNRISCAVGHRRQPADCIVGQGLPHCYTSSSISSFGGLDALASPCINGGSDPGPLVLGARSLLAHATNRTDRISRWALALQERVGYGKAVVAIAAKNARLAWATLTKGEVFRPLTRGGPCRPAGRRPVPASGARDTMARKASVART
jgi:hypothetical protein